MTQSALSKGIALFLTMALIALPFGLIALYVGQKHQWAQAKLTEIEPRYARLLGLESRRQDLAEGKTKAAAFLERHTYPSTQDESQTVNDAQQRVRSVFSAAGLEVSSTQALPSKIEKDFDRIAMTVRVDGELAALQTAMVGLAAQSPAILVDSFSMQPVGVVKVDAPIRLSAVFTLSVLRVRP